MPLPLGQGVFAHRAGAHEIDQEMPLRIRARLQANLEIKLWHAHRCLGDCAGIVNVVGHRRFTVHVFTCLECGKRDLPVQMRRRGNHDGLHIFIRKQLRVRPVLLGLGRSAEASPQISRISVAHGDDRCIGNRRQRLEQLPPPDAAPDHAEVNRRCVVVFRGIFRLAKRLRRQFKHRATRHCHGQARG